MHLSLDLCLLVIRRALPADRVAFHAHQHLLETCPICRGEHDVDREAADDEEGESPDPFPASPPATGTQPLPPLPDDPRHFGEADLEPRLALLARIQRLRDLDRRHLKHLMELEPDDWVGEVESARSRYRNRSFAEKLIEESRRRVRRQPEMARRLAALVPVVVRWIPESGGQPWAADLNTRAAAWEANALRVAGDLEGARRRFGALDLDRLLAGRSWTAGEVASLLASLRIEQRRVGEAARLLEQAREIFLRLGDSDSASRTLVQEGNLHSDASDPGRALAAYDQAAELLEGRAVPETLLCALQVGRILTLCDLERYREASDLLSGKEPLSEIEDPYLRAILRHSRGRIAVGRGRPQAAVPDLVSARDQFLATGRTYDAALASLDLAHAHLRAGQAPAARDLARNLVPQFQARGVGRETLAALSVLADAVTTEELTHHLLTRLRRRILAAPRTVGQAAER